MDVFLKEKKTTSYFMSNTEYISRFHMKMLSILQNNNFSIVRVLLHKLRAFNTLMIDNFLFSSRR